MFAHKRFKTTTVFFSGRYGFSVLPSSLQSAIYSCPRRTSRFLESVVTTRTTTTLAYNIPQITKNCCYSAARYRVWHSENLLHRLRCDLQLLWPAVLCLRNYACTCLGHKLRTMWAGFRACPHAIKSCLPRVYPWRHARDKMYQALPFLYSGKTLGTRLLAIVQHIFCIPIVYELAKFKSVCMYTKLLGKPHKPH